MKTWTGTFAFIMLACCLQAQQPWRDCYDQFREQGELNFNRKNYRLAIQLFEAAQKCLEFDDALEKEDAAKEKLAEINSKIINAQNQLDAALIDAKQQADITTGVSRALTVLEDDPTESLRAVHLWCERTDNANELAVSTRRRILEDAESQFYSMAVACGCTLSDMDLSNDGRWAALACHSGKLLLFDLTTHALTTVWQADSTAMKLYSVRFSPSGNRILLGALRDAILIDTLGAEIHRFKTFGRPAGAFSSDEKKLVIGDLSGYVNLFDLVTFDTLDRFGAIPYGDGIWDISMGTDERIYLACRDFTGRILKNGAVQDTMVGHTQEITAISISPNGRWIASVGNDFMIRLWDTDGHKNRDYWAAHFGRMVTSVHFSPDSRFLVSVGDDNVAHLWDLNFNRLKVFNGGKEGFVQAMFSPDGTKLITAGRNGTVRVWENPLEAWDDHLPHTKPVTCLAVHPSGNTVLTGSRDKTAKYWNRTTRQLLWTYKAPDEIMSAAISPNGRYGVLGLWNGEIHVLDLQDGIQIRRFRSGDLTQGGQYGHTSSVYSVAFLGDSIILSSGRDARVKCWNWSEARPFEEITNLPWPRMAASPTQNQFAVGSSNKILFYKTRFNRAKTGLKRIIKETHIDFGPSIQTLAYSHDGRYLLVAGDSGTAKIYLRNGKLYKVLAQPNSVQIQCAIFSKDNSLVYLGTSDGVVRVFNLETDAIIQNKALHHGAILTLEVLSDSLLLSAGIDNKIILSHQLETVGYFGDPPGLMQWAAVNSNSDIVATGNSAGYVGFYNFWQQTRMPFLYPAPEPVVTYAFSPKSGRYILGGMNNRKIVCWDTTNPGAAPAILAPSHSDAITAIDFRENGNLAISAAQNGELILWNLEPNSKFTSSWKICVWESRLQQGERFKIIDKFKGLRIETLKLLPYGLLLGVDSSGTHILKRWNLCTDNIENLAIYPAPITALNYISRPRPSELIAAADSAGNIWIFEAGKVVKKLRSREAIRSLEFYFEPASRNTFLLSLDIEGIAALWHAGGGEGTRQALLSLALPKPDLAIAASIVQNGSNQLMLCGAKSGPVFFPNRLIDLYNTADAGIAQLDSARWKYYLLPVPADTLCSKYENAAALRSAARDFTFKFWQYAADSTFQKARKLYDCLKNNFPDFDTYSVLLEMNALYNNKLYTLPDTSSKRCSYSRVIYENTSRLFQRDTSAEYWKQSMVSICWDHSWYLVLGGRFQEAYDVAKEGLDIDVPTNRKNGIITNKALAMLFMPSLGDAKPLYDEWKDRPWVDARFATFRGAFLDDLKSIKKIPSLATGRETLINDMIRYLEFE